MIWKLHILQRQHCVLDIHVGSVERLHQNQIYPIVLLIKFKSVKQIKEVRSSITECKNSEFVLGEGSQVPRWENHTKGRKEYLRAYSEAWGRVQAPPQWHRPRRGKPDAYNSPDPDKDRSRTKQDPLGSIRNYLVMIISINISSTNHHKRNSHMMHDAVDLQYLYDIIYTKIWFIFFHV